MKNLFFLSKIEDSNWGQERKFIRKNGQKSKFRSKIEIEVKNRNLDQKSKFRSKIEIQVTNRNLGQNFKVKL